jgi:hypothetical protein
MAEIKHPEIHVQLIGTDGNAFALIGKVAGAIRSNVGSDAATEFVNAATSSGSYDELLARIQRTVNVD